MEPLPQGELGSVVPEPGLSVGTVPGNFLPNGRAWKEGAHSNLTVGDLAGPTSARRDRQQPCVLVLTKCTLDVTW